MQTELNISLFMLVLDIVGYSLERALVALERASSSLQLYILSYFTSKYNT